MPSPTSPEADDFEVRLRELCNTAMGPYLRPFAPNTEWRSAQVFVVGTNPATPLRDEFASFDTYWHGLTVDPSVFDEVSARDTGAVRAGPPLGSEGSSPPWIR